MTRSVAVSSSLMVIDGALVVAAMLAIVGVPLRTTSGGPLILAVNSTADDDDMTCEQPPDGDCTLHETIDLISRIP